MFRFFRCYTCCRNDKTCILKIDISHDNCSLMYCILNSLFSLFVQFNIYTIITTSIRLFPIISINIINEIDIVIEMIDDKTIAKILIVEIS